MLPIVRTIESCCSDSPSHPAAREAAVRVHPLYARHLSSMHAEAVLLPDLPTIETLINAAFWASLRREEVYTPKISLAFVTPGLAGQALRFERPVPLTPQPLTRLGPAVERPGIHLCVAPQGRELWVWGATRTLPESCFVLEVVAPGLLVLKQARGKDSGKFINIAVLQGEEIKVIDSTPRGIAHCPELLRKVFGSPLDYEPPDSVSILMQLAVSIRSHGRGGSLLVVPAGTEVWGESLLQPITYSVSPSFTGLADLMLKDSDEKPLRRWQEALRRAVEGVAGLTAVDGATVITDQYEVLGFGAKIVRKTGSRQVDRVVVTEPIEGSVAAVVEPSELGGTRHFSAAQFAHDQRDAIAFVASQDGRFTVFGWSGSDRMVHAHRIEALLL